METRVLRAPGDGTVTVEMPVGSHAIDAGWRWIDVKVVGDDDVHELEGLADRLRLDKVAIRDAVEDADLPKVDDFGHHLLVVLHGLRDDRIATYEIDCFVSADHLVTVRRFSSQAVEALWNQLLARPEMATGGVDELVARLADVLTRRLSAVVDAFDDRSEELVDSALAADADLPANVTAVRGDIAAIRSVVHPQRETFDLLRHSSSPLLTHAGRRRFSDVFDVASRVAQRLEAARSELAEVLDAYRGAEARKATDVTRVLTIYAALILPLSLITGFFGMNFTNLPGIHTEWGWVIVTVTMLAIALVSFGTFVALGWIRRPSGRQAGTTLGRGLFEAARAPAHIAGAAYEVSTMPLRSVGVGRSRRSADPPAQ